MRLGIHMPQKGGFARNVERAAGIGCQALQFFIGSPTGWKPLPLDPAEAERRRLVLQENGIFPYVVHAAYLINLCAKKEEFYDKSRILLQQTMENAALIGSPYVVLHVGSHGGKGYKEGMKLFISTLEAEIPKWPPGVELLLENTAGGGTQLGATFIAIGNILKALGADAPLGLCLDTAHAWAAGYDLATPEGLERAMEELFEHVGQEKVKVIHLNDNATPRGSHRDRHAHLGDGFIGDEGLKAFLSYAWPENMPAILETPEMGSNWDAINMGRLRSYFEE